MLRTILLLRKLTTVALLTVVVASCTTKLAPEYDKAIVDSLTSNSSKLFELFASTSQGTKKADFSKREASYNQLIGAFEALKIQSESRPIPSNTAMNKANDYLTKRGLPAITSDIAPSSLALGEVVRQLTAMRENDNRKDMSEDRVELYKNPIAISLDQAITYESFLER
ncbi:hypothetical protein [Pseudomonas ogarae]|uniref:hypothetical protein n=1 Tax=Pseudomonas ogarae (strain DSM 112162 / CECT 30235 / F113) TaxID=1114970 RepID=UPI00194EEB91|nr:hypothetical protein [Pseudomonas ogarae]